MVVLDAVAYSYPLIHPNWVYSRIFGDSLESIVAEERRLFYVALTRAEQTLVIFTDGRENGQKISPFVAEIKDNPAIHAIDWEVFLPVRGSADRLVVKVGNRDGCGSNPTFAIKDTLKKRGYIGMSQNGKFVWTKTLLEQDIDALKSERWVVDAKGVDVRIFDETGENLIKHYKIDNGRWPIETSKAS